MLEIVGRWADTLVASVAINTSEAIKGRLAFMERALSALVDQLKTDQVRDGQTTLSVALSVGQKVRVKRADEPWPNELQLIGKIGVIVPGDLSLPTGRHGL